MPRKTERIRVERGLYRAGTVYYACATPPGARQAQWKTLGRVGRMEARRLRDEFAVAARRQKPTPATRQRFVELAGEWLEEQRRRVQAGQLTQRTYAGYESGLRLHALPTLGRLTLVSITADDLARWNRDLLAQGYARDSIHAWWTPLRLALSYAVRQGSIATNPADQLLAHERPRAGQARTRFLSRDEMAALLSTCPARYRLPISLGLFAGLRLSEVLGLTWADVHVKDGRLSIEAQMGRDGRRRPLKTATARRDVILMRRLGQDLKRHRLASPYSGGTDLVFATATGRTIGHRNLTGRGLERACEAAGVRGVTFHALRHTFASLLIAQGHDPVFVARQLGHTNPAVTLRVYAHLFDAARHAREAREALDRQFGELLAGRR